MSDIDPETESDSVEVVSQVEVRGLGSTLWQQGCRVAFRFDTHLAWVGRYLQQHIYCANTFVG